MGTGNGMHLSCRSPLQERYRNPIMPLQLHSDTCISVQHLVADLPGQKQSTFNLQVPRTPRGFRLSTQKLEKKNPCQLLPRVLTANVPKR